MSTLYLVATPIGNLEDISLRALRVLGEVQVLACEDTRRTAVLLQRHGVRRPEICFSHHEHNEARAAAQVLTHLDAGRDVAVCSNAGYPGISDPGYSAVALALAAGHRVEAIPGASAIPLALLVSGLPTSSYTFLGFLPRKSGRRNAVLAQQRDLPHTLVLYESPLRVGRLLAEAGEVLGDRRAAVCLELTKQFERVHRGWLTALAQEFASLRVKGEATVVIAGNHPKFSRTAGVECTLSVGNDDGDSDEGEDGDDHDGRTGGLGAVDAAESAP
jgi:16S rRNA (cytidine1402-2'-O)-methyltransferase